MGEEDNILIIFPEFEQLKSQVEKLRTELSMLLLERDELKFVICKNIETNYMLKLGAIEYNVYKAWCTSLRLKRKLEMIQAKKNRQEPIDIDEIEGILDDEFARYQKKLDEQMGKMNEAIRRSNGEVLSEEEAKELKKLYRAIVKAIHPDLNPNVSEEEKNLFEGAVSAYKNGDLATMRIIYEMICANINPQEDQNPMTHLKESVERLKASLKKVSDEIRDIKTKYPYTKKRLLEDEEKLGKEKDRLKKTLDGYNEVIKSYENRIEELLR